MKKKRIVITIISVIVALIAVAVVSSGVLFALVKSPVVSLSETAYI